MHCAAGRSASVSRYSPSADDDDRHRRGDDDDDDAPYGVAYTVARGRGRTGASGALGRRRTRSSICCSSGNSGNLAGAAAAVWLVWRSIGDGMRSKKGGEFLKKVEGIFDPIKDLLDHHTEKKRTFRFPNPTTAKTDRGASNYQTNRCGKRRTCSSRPPSLQSRRRRQQRPRRARRRQLASRPSRRLRASPTKGG